MRYLITGHRGLIGSHLKERLDKENECIMAIDKRNGQDVNDLAYVDDIKADMMFHFGAQCKINQAIQRPIIQHRNNAEGTFNVLEFCRRNKIPKIMFASSSRVLSKERNPYVAGKIYGEELCKAYHECYGLEYIIIRPSTVYGPCYDETGRALHNFVVQALRNEEITIYGDKDKTLDYTFISDFIDGVMLSMYQWNTDYNISGSEECKVSDVAERIIRYAESSSKIIYKSAEIAQPQQVHVDTTKIDNLGFRPKVRIAEGIKLMVDWYKSHPAAWQYYKEARTFNGQLI